MTLENIYEELTKENIDILNWKMNNVKSRIVKDQDYTIYVDYSKIDSETTEKEVLAEEFAHYKTSSYYNIQSTQEYIDKQEYKAQKYKSLKLCTRKDINKCLRKGKNTLYEIAEELQILPETAEFAINYYKENKLLKTNAKNSINF